MVGGQAGTVQLMRTRSLHADAQLPCPAPAGQVQPDVANISFAANDTCAVVHYADHSVASFDLQRKSAINIKWHLAGHASCIWAMTAQMSASGVPCIASGDGDGVVHMWSQGAAAPTAHASRSLRQPAQLQRLQHTGSACLASQHGADAGGGTVVEAATPAAVQALCLQHDGSRMAAGDSNGTLHIFDTDTMQLILRRATHEGQVRALAYTPATESGVTVMASAGDDGLVHIFDATADEYTILQSLDEHQGIGITTICFLQSGGSIVTAAQDSTVSIRAIRAGLYTAVYEIQCNSVIVAGAEVPALNAVALLTHDGWLRVLDSTTAQELHTCSLQCSAAPATMSICGMTAAAIGFLDGSMQVLDITQGTQLTAIQGHSDAVTSIATADSAACLLTAGVDASLQAWDVPVGAWEPPVQPGRLATLPLRAFTVADACQSEDMLQTESPQRLHLPAQSHTMSAPFGSVTGGEAAHVGSCPDTPSGLRVSLASASGDDADGPDMRAQTPAQHLLAQRSARQLSPKPLTPPHQARPSVSSIFCMRNVTDAEPAQKQAGDAAPQVSHCRTKRQRHRHQEWTDQQIALLDNLEGDLKVQVLHLMTWLAKHGIAMLSCLHVTLACFSSHHAACAPHKHHAAQACCTHAGTTHRAPVDQSFKFQLCRCAGFCAPGRV